MNNAIFLTFDENYTIYAKACIRSLKKNYPNHPKLLVLYTGYNPPTIRWLESIERLILLPAEEYVVDSKDFPVGPIGSKIVYQRFILWTDKFDAYDNILHLDVDTLILGTFDIVFEKNEFFAVCDNPRKTNTGIFKAGYKKNKTLNKKLREDNIVCSWSKNDMGSEMINAGIFMIPKCYRNQYYFEQLFDIAQTYSEFIAFADQSIISLWMLKNNLISSKELRFNFQTTYFHNLKIIYLFEDIKILHFSWVKPFSNENGYWWGLGGRGPQLKYIYRQYLDNDVAVTLL